MSSNSRYDSVALACRLFFHNKINVMDTNAKKITTPMEILNWTLLFFFIRRWTALKLISVGDENSSDVSWIAARLQKIAGDGKFYDKVK